MYLLHNMENMLKYNNMLVIIKFVFFPQCVNNNILEMTEGLSGDIVSRWEETLKFSSIPLTRLPMEKESLGFLGLALKSSTLWSPRWLKSYSAVQALGVDGSTQSSYRLWTVWNCNGWHSSGSLCGHWAQYLWSGRPLWEDPFFGSSVSLVKGFWRGWSTRKYFIFILFTPATSPGRNLIV